MATITHTKSVNLTQVPDPTQADLDAQIALGNYPAGTLLADISLGSDWNANHTIVLGADENFVTDAEKTKLSNLSGTNTGDVTLSGENYLSLTGQALTASKVNITSHMTGLGTANAIPTVNAGATALEFVYGINQSLQTVDSPTFSGVTLSGQTASTIAAFDGSKAITSLSTSTYPSLAELAYGKGVTSAIQTQLDGKIPTSYLDTDGTLAANSDSKIATQKAVKTYVDNAVIGLLDYRGSYDASSNLFPASGGSGLLGAVVKGDFWMSSASGTLGGTAVTAGDLIIALVDTPGQTAANWDLIPHDLGSYVTSVSGTANRITSTGGSTPVIDVSSSLWATTPSTTKIWDGTTLATSYVGLGNVTNDAQTKAAIVPNTAPSSGQILVGNAGGTAYAPVSASGAVTLASTGAFTIATPGTLTVSSSNSTATAHTHAITSSSAPGAAASILATDASGIIGSTGTRIVKGWFTDITCTNAIAADITGNAATVSSANEAADTTCFPLFITASGTQTLATKNNTGFTYNASTNNLGATTFTGALSGNATTATALATPRTIGGVSFDGSANIVPQTIQSVNEATDTTCFPLFISASGSQSLQPLNNVNLTFNASTATLGATNLSGTLTTASQTNITGVGTITTGTWNATDIAVADGGTGRSTGTTAYSLIATGTTATGAQQTLANGATTEILVGGGASALPVWTTASGTGAPLRQGTPTITTPVINGLPTGTGVSATATVSTLASRDSSGNSGFNNALEGYTTTATAAGTTTLTVASTADQYFTGSTTQTVTLPVTSTLTLGHTFNIDNASTGAVTINSSGGNAVLVLAGGTSCMVSCILTSGTDAASWKATYLAANAATGKKLTVSNSITLAGTDGTTMTFPSTTATIARTDAANTFTGTQTFNGTVALGSQSITMTGSIAATGSRVTKGWFTDVESTNAPSVNGTAATGASGGLVRSGTPSFLTTIGVGGATAAASGAGVSFPATQSASTDANTLDDYEEGTFTPTIVSTGGGAPTYTAQTGYYTKIGNRVFYETSVVLATLGTLAAGNITIAGLPFTSEATANHTNPQSIIGNALAASATTSLQATINNNVTAITPVRFTAGAFVILTVADLTGTSVLRCSGHYSI